MSKSSLIVIRFAQIVSMSRFNRLISNVYMNSDIWGHKFLQLLLCEPDATKFEHHCSNTTVLRIKSFSISILSN